MQINTALSPRLAIFSLISLAAVSFGFTSCQSNPQNKTALPQKQLKEQNPVPVTLSPPEPKPTPLPIHEGDHFPVFDLLHNRPLAHRLLTHKQGDVFTLEASAMDVVRYVHGNHPNQWKLPVALEDETVMMVRGKRATLYFPSWTPKKADTLQMRLHNPNKKPNAIKLRLNGRVLKQTNLKPGWQTIDLEVPSGTLRAENKLEISFTRVGKYNRLPSGGALRWLRVGPKLAIDDHLPKQNGALVSLDNTPQGHHELRLKPQHGLIWMMWLPKNGKLNLTMHTSAQCAPTLKLDEQGGGGRLKPLLSRQIVPVDGLGKTQSTTIDLSKQAGEHGKVVRVELSNRNTNCKDTLAISKAQVLLKGKRPVVPKIEPPKYVIFWKVDTLRADYLPFYGDPITKAPALSDIAKHGALFKTAFVEGNESRVSHASMFSGMFPSKHGVHPQGKLAKQLTILPEMFKNAGYQTLGRASNGYVSKTYGYEQGWDKFSNDLQKDLSYDGKSIVYRAKKWVTKHHKKPFFFYVGTVDPHASYRAHEGLIEMYDNEPYKGQFKRYITGKNLGAINRRVIKVNERDKKRIIALYRNEITFNDQAFADMRAHFEKLGIWQDTLVVLTADHGDGFWEHRKVGHGHNLHQELVHVPLVIHYPKMLKKGVVIEAGADVMDIYPTLQALLGQKRNPDVQGKNLLHNIFKTRGDYPETANANFELRRYTMQSGPWKINMRRNRIKLYNRANDRLELRNVVTANPLAHRWMLDALSYLRFYRKGWDKSKWGEPNNLTEQFIPLSQGQVDNLVASRDEDDDDIRAMALVPR